MENYNSKQGMITRIWGPPLWHFLHTISFNYPVHPNKSDKLHYLHFIKQLQFILPCKYCRINLKKNFKILPINLKTMESRHSFSLYIYNLHELINKMLNKKSNLTFEQVRERYESFRSKCSPNTKKTRKKTEKGCIIPLHNSKKKTKCVLKIIPEKSKISSF
uniref:thiol oxidase n=1 Tax=viral metagenome TaxID=1070528 RepID=A0A6C0H4W4_9ZZZZ